MSEKSSVQTKRKRKQYCTRKLIKSVRQVTLFNTKIKKFVGDNSRQDFSISGVWHVGWWNLITSVRLIQVGNNRNDHFKSLFRCPGLLNRGVRLIKVLFKVNKGNRIGDFGCCPLNRGCPLNTGFTVGCQII